MTIAKEPQCDSHAVTSLVKHTVAGAEQDTDVGAELSFILPSQSIHQFSKLFDTLDGNYYTYIFLSTHCLHDRIPINLIYIILPSIKYKIKLLMLYYIM